MHRIGRNSDGIHLFQSGMLMMGCATLVKSLSGGVPMPVQTHGTALYEIPAELWAFAVIGAALWTMWAVRYDRLFSLVFAGIFGATLYIALYLFTGYAEFGFLLSLGSGVIGFLYCSISVAAMLDIACRGVEKRLHNVARGIGK